MLHPTEIIKILCGEKKCVSCNGPYTAVRFSGGFPGWCYDWSLAVDLVYVNTGVNDGTD